MEYHIVMKILTIFLQLEVEEDMELMEEMVILMDVDVVEAEDMEVEVEMVVVTAVEVEEDMDLVQRIRVLLDSVVEDLDNKVVDLVWL